MTAHYACRLLNRPANDAGCGDDAVDTLDFQGQQAQVIGELLDGSLAQGLFFKDLVAGAVQIPLEVERVLELVLDVVDVLESVVVEHADAGDGVWEVVDALVELGVEGGSVGLPFALDQDEFAGAEFEADVGSVAAAAALGAGVDASGAEELSEEGIDGFLASGFGHGLDCRTSLRECPPLSLRDISPRLAAGGEGEVGVETLS